MELLIHPASEFQVSGRNKVRSTILSTWRAVHSTECTYPQVRWIWMSVQSSTSSRSTCIAKHHRKPHRHLWLLPSHSPVHLQMFWIDSISEEVLPVLCGTYVTHMPVSDVLIWLMKCKWLCAEHRCTALHLWHHVHAEYMSKNCHQAGESVGENEHSAS